MMNEVTTGVNFVETTSMKKRALARATGSLGRRSESGYRSATNSARISDSASFTDSREGFSGATFGPPYAIAGTFEQYQTLWQDFGTGKTPLTQG